MAEILIIEDEKSISDLMKLNLELVGHQCVQAYDAPEALYHYQGKHFDLILLDVMLPGKSGFELIDYFKGTAVIYVTAKEEIADRIRGLNSGAEDYIVKPFEMIELIARVNIVLRRFQKAREEFTYKDVTINFEQRKVKKNGELVNLRPKEFELLEILITNRNIALSRDRLLELVWNYECESDTRTVDVHIQKLRKKLGWTEEIQTVYKLGYRLEVEL